MYMNINEARAAFAQDRAMLEAKGIVLPGVQSYIPAGWESNFHLAMDAQPTLSTDPNSAVPAMLTTLIDPEVFRILFSPTQAAAIYGEVKKGTWLDETAMFPVVEQTGEVSSYGDYSTNGSTGVNTNWPQRQSYLFQTIKQYGQRELERAGLARIGWVSELDAAAAQALNRFANLTYFFGVTGLQNYGALNDPNLSAALTPATKAYGGTKWINNGVVQATANEIYADIQSVYSQLVSQSGGLIDQNTPIILAMSPGSAVALTTTNAFGVNVEDLLKKNFPKITIMTAVQYGVTSSSNPNGIAAGNFMQMIAKTVDGQQTAYVAFNEKQRAHPIVVDLSAFKQKVTAGTWGAIIRGAFGIAAMVGI